MHETAQAERSRRPPVPWLMLPARGGQEDHKIGHFLELEPGFYGLPVARRRPVCRPRKGALFSSLFLSLPLCRSRVAAARHNGEGRAHVHLSSLAAALIPSAPLLVRGVPVLVVCDALGGGALGAVGSGVVAAWAGRRGSAVAGWPERGVKAGPEALQGEGVVTGIPRLDRDRVAVAEFPNCRVMFGSWLLPCRAAVGQCVHFLK